MSHGGEERRGDVLFGDAVDHVRESVGHDDVLLQSLRRTLETLVETSNTVTGFFSGTFLPQIKASNSYELKKISSQVKKPCFLHIFYVNDLKRGHFLGVSRKLFLKGTEFEN